MKKPWILPVHILAYTFWLAWIALSFLRVFNVGNGGIAISTWAIFLVLALSTSFSSGQSK